MTNNQIGHTPRLSELKSGDFFTLQSLELVVTIGATVEDSDVYCRDITNRMLILPAEFFVIRGVSAGSGAADILQELFLAHKKRQQEHNID